MSTHLDNLAFIRYILAAINRKIPYDDLCYIAARIACVRGPVMYHFPDGVELEFEPDLSGLPTKAVIHGDRAKRVVYNYSYAKETGKVDQWKAYLRGQSPLPSI